MNKMQIFYLWLLMLHVVSSVVSFETKTVHIKQDVELTCANQKLSTLFWMRIISGYWPELLGGTRFSAKSNRITTKQESGTFVLRINEANLNDSGLYYCVDHYWNYWTFVTGYIIKVEETESDIISIIQEPPTVYPGVQTSVKCSLLSNHEKNMCSDSPAFYWFKSESDKSHPSFIYTHNDGGEDCNRNLTPSVQKCFSSFSRNFSDPGIYHCAVAVCGHILWGQESHQHTQQNNTEDIPIDLQEQSLHWSITVSSIICAVLTITVIVLIYYICSMKKKTCNSSCYEDVGSATGDFHGQQRDEDPCLYSASVFNKTTSWQQGRIYTVVVFQQTSTCKVNDTLKKAVFSLKQI